MDIRSILLSGALVGAATASAVNLVGDSTAQTIRLDDRTVIMVTQTGTLQVTEPGEIEILVVGGGGGGGVAGSETYLTGGGGASNGKGGSGIVIIRYERATLPGLMFIAR